VELPGSAGTETVDQVIGKLRANSAVIRFVERQP
jgi:hypothetical protein